MTKLGLENIKKRNAPGKLLGKRPRLLVVKKDFEDMEKELIKCWEIIKKDRAMAREVREMSFRLSKISIEMYKKNNTNKKNESSTGSGYEEVYLPPIRGFKE